LNDYETYIHKSRYARWRDEDKRREDWPETVRRYINFLQDKYHPDISGEVWTELENSILEREIMPSMRALMTAGPALERDNVAGYNCAYLPIEHPRAFDELMYILMCGTGVGFSVERQYVSRLPEIAEEFHETDTVLRVPDSKIGWSSSFRELIALLYSGRVPKWDTSKVRKAGTPLKTFGGRASGPEPLEELFRFTVEVFRGAAGRKLNSLEAHDICCKIADIVIVGGVRRSALISLSNLTDERMRKAKRGEYRPINAQRDLANNSACYTEKPDIEIFMREWLNLVESKNGERGIFYRTAAQRKAGENGRRDENHEFGTNPCSEIILRPYQFCNLTEVVVRDTDTFEDLKRKVRYATILGTLQSTLTDFRYLRPIWKRNCEEERLLGVSLTGIMDHPILSGKYEIEDPGQLERWLQELKEAAIETNKEWTEKLGINQSTAITCVKPSGTVSQLCNTSSGIHPRYSKYYIRSVRNDKKDPLCQFLIDQGVPYEDAVGKEDRVAVFSFPIRSPNSSVVSADVCAIEQLELWRCYAENWCEHKPSVSIYVKQDEWLQVGAWVYENFDIMSGVSFFPKDTHIYKQAPYQPITEEEYDKLVEKFPKINWEEFKEGEDTTTASHELACAGGACEL